MNEFQYLLEQTNRSWFALSYINVFITSRVIFWLRWIQANVFFCPTDIKSIYIVYSVTGHPYFQYDLLCAFFVVINVFIVFKTLILWSISVKRPIMSGFSFSAMGKRICFPALIQFLLKHKALRSIDFV